ncbi:DUF368 domain-containing protein [Alkalicoccobacillus porphyridii]|uniref:DUF368 domain-containing protein n=1 Tax=Alkalicoccobacillus porphyridii TaxID=2597270 RepID=A0A553ZVC4_9BACI|nr:DUF368 domain-containing protein [Alkalicoccobacillus porphyridii]
MEYKNLLRGIAMGVTDVVPGISGSTILMVLGVYERFIASLSGLTNPREWKKSLGFLVPLGLGVVTAMIVFARVIRWFLDHHQPVTLFFFIGLIVGILPILAGEINIRRSFKPIHYVLLVIAFICIAFTALIPSEVDLMTNLSMGDYILLFVSGWLASAALILPGISGALVFLLLGVYTTVIHAISEFQLLIIFVVGAGIAVGMLLTSKLVRYLFANYTTYTYAVMIGLVAGSIVVIYSNVLPGGSVLGCTLTFLAGLVIAYLLGKVKK